MPAAGAVQGSERDPFSLVAAHIYPRYQQALKAFNAVDFDDLLVFGVRLFDENPDLLEHYRQRFQFQMVDEYQDTNPVQYRLLQLLAGGHGNLCVVGDDDQSIYAFRGADVSNILDFEKDFPNSKVIKLEQNYRSSGNILACANAVIKQNRKRRDKALWTAYGDGAAVEYLLCEDSEDEARMVMERIHTEMARGNFSYGDFAILYRTNTQSRSYEEQLNYEDIPFVLIGGQQFFERKEVKDVISYLKVMVNPNDEVNLLRILNYPKRGIGESTIDRMIRYSAEHNIPLWKLLHHPEEVGEINEKTQAAMLEFTDLIRRYSQLFSKSLPMVETLKAFSRRGQTGRGDLPSGEGSDRCQTAGRQPGGDRQQPGLLSGTQRIPEPDRFCRTHLPLGRRPAGQERQGEQARPQCRHP